MEGPAAESRSSNQAHLGYTIQRTGLHTLASFSHDLSSYGKCTYSYRNSISGATMLSVYQTGNLSRQSSSSCLRYKFDRYTVRLKPCVPALRYVYRSATLSGRTGYSPGVILVITRATTIRPHGEYLGGMVSVARINARKSIPRSENTPASMFVRHSGSPTPPIRTMTTRCTLFASG